MNTFLSVIERANQWFNKTVVSLLNDVGIDNNPNNLDKGEKRKAFVVVYGHTRSGKTTVVLKLLQVRDSRFSDLYNALCGGRGAGDSSTPPAAFKYTKAVDERFSVISYNGCCYQQSYANTLDELRDLIAVVRNEILCTEEHIYSVSIGIPSCYFDDESKLIDVDVIDLPGDYCRDMTEHASVRKVFGYYLQRATRIFFVNPEDKPKVLKQSLIDQQAHAYSSKTRIILTHIAHSETEQKEIPRLTDQIDENKCVDVLRDHYMKFIKSQIIKPDIEPHQLFLFNAGREMDEQMPQGIKERLQPIVSRFVRLIIDDINKSAQPAEIVSQFSDIKKEIQGKLQHLDDFYIEGLNSIDKKLNNARSCIADLQEKINCLKQDKFTNIQYFINNSDTRNDIHRYSLPMIKDQYNERCSDFLNFIRKNSSLVNSSSIPEIDAKRRKLFEHIPIDNDDDLIQIFDRKRKNVFLFIKGKNPSYPHEIIKYLNNKLDEFVKSKNNNLSDVYESMVLNLSNRLNKLNKYVELLQNRAKSFQVDYETNRNTCLSQIDLCDKYFDHIESRFESYYLKNKSDAENGKTSSLDFLLETYFISNILIKSRRCER